MFIRSLALFSFALILGACGARHSKVPKRDYSPQGPTTGYDSYTISGNPEIYEELRDGFKDKDPTLARSIQKIQVQELQTGEHQISVLMNGNYFQLRKLVFQDTLPKVGSERRALIQNPFIEPHNFQTKFTLDIRCRSLDCTLMEMQLQESSNSANKAEAVWMYQQKETSTRFIESDKGGLDKLKVNIDDTKSVQTSVVVIDGPAYSQVRVTERNAKPEDEPLLIVETDLVNTQEHAENVKSVKLRGEEEVTAVLQGNDPNTGSLMVDIQDTDSDSAVRVIFDNRSEGRQVQRVHLGIADGRLNPKGISPEVDAYTAALDAYATNPEVQKRIELWLTGKGNKACGHKMCKAFYKNQTPEILMNLQAIIPQVQEASEMTNVSPEKAYVLAMESAFLKSPGFPIQVYNGNANSTAAGPWQITNTTGNEIVPRNNLPFKIMPLQGAKPNRTLHPSDDRNYIFESTVMAFSYYGDMPSELSHDPGLQIVAYYKGPNKIKELVRRHGAFKPSLYDLAGMSSFTGAEYFADYAYSMIALRFIGMNPESHGLDIPMLSEVPAALRPKLRNPNR